MMTSDKHQKRLDEKFENLLKEVRQDVSETELTPEKAAERRARADASDLEFCRIYYPKIFDSPFNPLHEKVATWEKGKYTLGGYRECGKTAFVFIAKVVKAIAQGKAGIINICLRTQMISKERSSHIFRLVNRNTKLKYDYDIKVDQEQKGYYIINNCHLVATSVETGLRNYIDDDFKRFSISINDDLYNRVSVNSELDNQRVTSFVTSEVYGQMAQDGLSITMGNAITPTAPIEQLKTLFPENHYELPHKDAQGNPTWPERHSVEYWEEKEKEIPYDILQAEYYLKPVERGEVFDKEDIRFINVNTLTIISSQTVIDPAHGQSPDSCDKGITTLGMASNHKVVVLDIEITKKIYPLVFDYLYESIQTKPAHKVILFENDFAQWNFAAPYYTQWMQDRAQVLPLMMFNSRDMATQQRGYDKDSRIMNLVHPHTTGQILYDQDLPGKASWFKFNNQFFAYGKHKTKLDALDSMATNYILIGRYKETGSFKATAQRTWKKGGFR